MATKPHLCTVRWLLHEVGQITCWPVEQLRTFRHDLSMLNNGSMISAASSSLLRHLLLSPLCRSWRRLSCLCYGGLSHRWLCHLLASYGLLHVNLL